MFSLKENGIVWVLVVQASVLAFCSWANSPTYDEPGHLAAGLSNWELNRFDLYKVNPPLVKMLAAAPVALSAPDVEWNTAMPFLASRPEFRVGAQFVHRNRSGIQWYLFIARMTCIPFATLSTFLVFQWSRDLAGKGAGYCAALFWGFSPAVLGHGPLITADIAATTMALATAWIYRRWLRDPTWSGAVFLGSVIGLSFLTKFSLVILIPVYILATMPFFIQAKMASAIGRMVTLFLIAILVVNVGYGCEDSMMPLGEIPFYSQTLAGQCPAVDQVHTICPNVFHGTVLQNVPVPLPRNYLQGIDIQKIDFEAGTQLHSYFAGTARQGGWWYYYCAAAMVKLSHGTQLVLAAGLLIALWCLRGGIHGADTSGAVKQYVLLLASPAILLTLICSQHRFTDHFRYAFPALPFLLIASVSACFRAGGQTTKRLVATFLILHLMSVAAHAPNWISYFNEVSGGSRNAHRWLSGSNLDWGQNTRSLVRWQLANPEAKPFYACLATGYDPVDEGLVCEVALPLDGSLPDKFMIPAGWHAISVTALTGMPYASFGEGGDVQLPPGLPYTAFRQLEPTHRIGGTINIYLLDDDLPVERQVGSKNYTITGMVP